MTCGMREKVNSDLGDCQKHTLPETTSSGLPHVAVGVSSCFALLAYLAVKDGPSEVFSWFSDFSSTAGLITWFGIGVTYLRFYDGLKAKRIDRKTLPFAPRVQPFAAWWCVCGSGFSLIVRFPSSSREVRRHSCVIHDTSSSARGMYSLRANGPPSPS